MSSICTKLRQLHSLLDLILAFGDRIMQDFLVMHSMVSFTRLLYHQIMFSFILLTGKFEKMIEE